MTTMTTTAELWTVSDGGDCLEESCWELCRLDFRRADLLPAEFWTVSNGGDCLAASACELCRLDFCRADLSLTPFCEGVS